MKLSLRPQQLFHAEWFTVAVPFQ